MGADPEACTAARATAAADVAAGRGAGGALAAEVPYPTCTMLSYRTW